MDEQTKSVLTRTVTIGDIEPSELASIFTQYDSKQQAKFFDCLVSEGESFKTGSWSMQWCWMGMDLTNRARILIEDMYDNVRPS